MKRFVATLLALLLVFTMLPVQANAANKSMVMTVSGANLAEVQNGDTLTISIKLPENCNFGGATLGIKYDQTIFEIVSATSNLANPVTKILGQVRVTYLNLDAENVPFTSSQDMLTVSLKTIGNKNATTSIEMDVCKINVFNAGGGVEQLPFVAPAAQSVTIKGAHVHTYDKVKAVAATCVKDGNIEYYTCTCGKYFKLDGANYVEISQAETVISKSTAVHQLTHVNAVVPTDCSTDAVKEHWKCTVCGKLFTDAAGNNETTLAKLTTPAKHLNIKPVAEVPATCTTNGVRAHYECTVCKKLFSDAAGTKETDAEALKIPAAHKLSNVAEVPATCTTNGVKAHYKCTVCEKLFSDAAGTKETDAEALKIPAAHNIVAVTKKDATCTENGYEAHFQCTVCKKLFSDKDGKNPIDAPVVIKAAHKPVKVDAKPSTCLAEGWTEHYKCSVCGQLFSDAAGETSIAKVPTLPLASHTAASSAYVSDANNHWQLCQWCGLKINEAGHTWNKPATEDDAVYCTECGYVKTAAKTPCEKHTPGDLVADGAYHYTFCAECGTQLSKKEHTYGEATTVDGKKVEVCTECGYVKTTTTTPITPGKPSKPGNTGSNTGSKPVQSQKTFDAGIALYAGMAVLSLTGSAWMITKKKKEH